MSKRYLYASLVGMAILVFALPLFAQHPDTLWTKTYGGTGQDTAYSVYPTSDGGYIIAGVTNSMGAGDWDGYLVKTDSLGNAEWDQTYGTEYADGFFDVLETSDGEYIASGWTASLFDTDYWLVRIDTLGDKVWEKIYGGGFNDSALTMVPAHDGDFLVVGYTWSYRADDFPDAWVLKFDPATGDTSWAKNYDPGRLEASADLFVSGCQASDEGYLFVGSSETYPPVRDVYLVKTDSVGDVIWSHLYAWDYYDRVYSACQTQGGYLVVGTANPTLHSEVLILKLDEAGDTVWTKLYGGEGNDRGYGIYPYGDSMYLISARTSSFGAGGYDLWMLAIDTLGDTLWTQTYGAEGDEWCYFRNRMNAKGNLMLPGFTSSWGAGGADFWLLEYGYEQVGIEESPILAESTIKVWTLLNRLAYDLKGSAYLTFYSADGRRILEDAITGKGVWEPPALLPQGVYFARIEAGEFRKTARLMIVR